MKLRLFIVLPTLEAGGQERVASILARHLQSFSIDVSLVILTKSDTFYKIDNVKIIYLNASRVINSFRPLIKLLRHESPSVVLSFATHVNIMMGLVSFLNNKNIKFLARESSIVSQNNLGSKFPSVFNFLIKLLYPRFSKIICQSEAMKSDLMDNYLLNEHQLVVINNPIESEINLKFSTVDQSFYPDKEKLNIITVGRFSNEKGYFRMLSLLSRLKIDFHYYIIGDGPLREKILHQITELNLNKKVTLLGIKQNVFSFISKCDVYLFGSYYEGFPNVLIEAGLLGIPVVGYKGIGGQNEIIYDQELGFLDDDEQKIIEYLITIKGTSNSSSIKIKTVEKYDVDNIIPTYFNEIIKLKTN